MDGSFLSLFKQGEIGPDLFRKACEFGPEVWFQSIAIGPIKPADPSHWIKVKNRKHHALKRVIDLVIARSRFQRALAAILAIFLRLVFVSFSARALPPARLIFLRCRHVTT